MRARHVRSLRQVCSPVPERVSRGAASRRSRLSIMLHTTGKFTEQPRISRWLVRVTKSFRHFLPVVAATFVGIFEV